LENYSSGDPILCFFATGKSSPSSLPVGSTEAVLVFFTLGAAFCLPERWFPADLDVDGPALVSAVVGILGMESMLRGFGLCLSLPANGEELVWNQFWKRRKRNI